MTLPEPYYQRDGITIYCADCRDILPLLPPVDLVLTDPPYGIAAGSAFWRKNGTEIADDGDAQHNVLVEAWREYIQLAPNSAIVEWTSGALVNLDRTRQGHRDAGWIEWRLYMMVKSAPAPTVRPTMVPCWETAVISYTGKRPWFGSGYVPDAWVGMTPNRLGAGVHPTQKPIEPMIALINALSGDAGYVLDPFMGSGTTLRAAMDLGRKAIGIEIEERYCEIAVKRLQQSAMNLNIA